jgi:hypothetical protein
LGFLSLADFSDHWGGRFSACKDGRHERSERAQGSPRRMTRDELLIEYQALIDSLDAKRTGTPKTLPPQTIKILASHFKGFNLSDLSLIRTQALKQGCFTDCQRIYCANDNQIMQWTQAEGAHISHELIHQIVHAQRCQTEGGRDRFVLRWFQHLPNDVHETLRRQEPLDSDRIHFAMYMESHANHRAEVICHRIGRCSME